MTVTRICFFGDSFVNGTGDETGLGWVGRVCAGARGRGHDVTFYNLGIRGDTSADVARRWQREADRRLRSEHDPRFVFSFGVNDVMLEDGATRLAQTESRAQAQAILAVARETAPTLMIGPSPVADREANGRIAVLEAMLGDLCDRMAIPYLDVFPALLADPVWAREVAAQDGAHPGGAGYARLAALVENWSAWRQWLP